MTSPREIEQEILAQLPYLAQQADLDLPTMVRENPSLRVSNQGELQNAPRNIGKYALIPLTSLPGVDRSPRQLYGTGDYTMPPNIQTHAAGNVRKRPMLEGPAALGITVEKDGQQHLCAVGAIQITEEGALKIVQLQGSITDGEIGPQLGGFRWSNALIEAWTRIAGLVGITTIEVSDAESRIGEFGRRGEEEGDEHEIQKNSSYRRNYNQAAAHAGLTRAQGSNVWRAAVAPRQESTVTAEAIPDGESLIGAIRQRLRHVADTSEYASDGAMFNLALAERAMVLANRELDSGDLDYDYPTIYRGISDEFQDAWRKVEESRVATYAAIQALRDFEQGL